MRNAFCDELLNVTRDNNKVIMLSADIGNRLFDNFKSEFPSNFYNCGVAEANTIGLAAGLALSGFRPIAYTITPFITFRCAEQIKIDLCYHNLPAIIVGVGAGLSYASLGSTHHSCEDIGMLRTFPNLTILCPGDSYEVRAALKAALKHNGPVYFRLGKKGEAVVHDKEPKFIIGKGITIQEGNDVCLISTGNVLPNSVAAGRDLAKQGISTKIVSLHTVKPLDHELLLEVFSKFKIIATIEEHSLIGGLGSSICEWMVDNFPETKAKLIRFGTPDKFPHITITKEYAHKNFGLSKDQIISRVKEKLNEDETGDSNNNSNDENDNKNIKNYENNKNNKINNNSESNSNIKIMNDLDANMDANMDANQLETQAAILVKTGQPLDIQSIKIPYLKPGQVLVDIAFSGVCHTQLLEARGHRGEDKYLPHCLGHEGSGIVKTIGPGVSKVKPGDKVILSWMKGSGHDVSSTTYSLNNHVINSGAITTFSKQSIISENRLTVINNNISLQEAALLGCAVATGLGSVFNVAQPKPGQSIAIFGAGGIGSCAILGAKIAGCYPIVAIDINEDKLLSAKEMGATHTINPNTSNLDEEIKQIVPAGLEFAIESSGVPQVMNQAIHNVKNQGGCAVIIGNAKKGQILELDPHQLNLGKRILGTWGGDNFPDEHFQRYINLIASKKLDLSKLTTKIYTLNQINEVLDDLENGKVLRPLIDMQLDVQN